MKAPLWVVGFVWTTLCIAVITVVIIPVMVFGWRDSVKDMWSRTALRLQQHIYSSIDDDLNFVRLAAHSVPYTDPYLSNLSMPDSGYDARPLIRNFKAFDDGSKDNDFTSMGIIQKAKNTPNGKVSWQIAKGFGCPDLIYAFAEPASYPAFYGYCAWGNTTINTTGYAYQATDWGLKPEEAKLVNGELDHTFLPVFSLLGEFMITHEIRWPPRSQAAVPYAVTFAEMSLRTFQAMVQNLDVLRGKGYAYVAEYETGLMMAASIPNVTLSSGDNRLWAHNSTAPSIRDTWNYAKAQAQGKEAVAAADPYGIYMIDGEVGGWLVSGSRYTDTGLDWLIVVVVSTDIPYNGMERSIGISGGISGGVVLLALCTTFALSLCYVRKEVARLKARIKGTAKSDERSPLFEFSEFAGIKSELNAVDNSRLMASSQGRQGGSVSANDHQVDT